MSLSAMCRYVRFHTLVRDCQTHCELGLFGAVGELDRAGLLTEKEQERVQEVFEWFNKNLAVPRLTPEHWRARFWFRDSAQDMIGRLWDVVAILRCCDVPVRFVTTHEPGVIVYQDKHQIAAIGGRQRRVRCGSPLPARAASR